MSRTAAIPGIENAFIKLYRAHFPVVYRHACSLTRCVEQANDLVQDVFLQCWLNMEKLESANDKASYLFILTRNQFINQLRRQQREQVSQEEYSRYYRQLYPPTDDPMQEREYQRLLETAIELLPLRQRQIFIMGKELSMKRKEISHLLQISELTTKAHLAKAVRTIKEKVETQLFIKLNLGKRIEN